MYKVLLVDDEYLPKMDLRKMVDWEAHDCNFAGTAVNGAEALAWHHQNKADIIITDLKMPVMDGIALVRALKSENFDGAILVLSNYADFELVREALVAGAFNYMLKINLDAAELSQQLTKTVEHIKMQRRNQLEDEGRSDMAQKYSARMRAEALRDYFLYEGVPVPSLTEYDTDAFSLCILSTQNCALQEKNRPKIVGHISEILCGAFEDIPYFDCFVQDERVVFLVPLAPLTAKGQRVEERLALANRQVKTYLNLTNTTTLLAPPTSTLPLLKQQYDRCISASALCFYAKCPTLLYSDKLCFPALFSDADKESLTSEAARLFLTDKKSDNSTFADRLIDECYHKRIHPDDVRRAFRSAAYRITLKQSAALPVGELESVVIALRNAKNQAALRDAFMETFILAQSMLKRKKGIPDVLEYLQQHYTEKITLDDISRVFFLEKSYLCRRFKKETGISLFQHINNLRMQRAAEMIAEGTVYVKEVASAVGLPDSFYFTRQFTKYYGLSPSAYRRTISEEV